MRGTNIVGEMMNKYKIIVEVDDDFLFETNEDRLNIFMKKRAEDLQNHILRHCDGIKSIDIEEYIEEPSKELIEYE